MCKTQPNNKPNKANNDTDNTIINEFSTGYN